MLQLGCLGGEGSHSHLAASLWEPGNYEVICFKSIPALLAAFGQHEVARAIVPLENSLEDVVTPTIDWLMRNAGNGHAVITGELFLPIRQALLALPQVEVSQICQVVSHPQALAQCRIFLNAKQWKETEALSTDRAAKQVAESSDPTLAAIASAKAAEIHGLKVLSEDIGDSVNNVTRFVILGGPKSKCTDSDRTTIFFITKNVPGALQLALSVFSVLGINLTKIASRAAKTSFGEYIFWVDAEAHVEDDSLKVAVSRLQEAFAEKVIIAGSYRKAKQPKEEQGC